MGGFFSRYPQDSSPQLSPGENRNVLLSISPTLEMSDVVFSRKEAKEELLQRLESNKNLLVQNMQVEHTQKIQHLEEERAQSKAFVEKLDETYEYLVLQNIQQIQQVRGCDAIVIKNEYELDLLMRYCMADSEFGNEAVPNKMIEIDTDLREEEFNNIIYQVQMRGWQWSPYLRRN